MAMTDFNTWKALNEAEGPLAGQTDGAGQDAVLNSKLATRVGGRRNQGIMGQVLEILNQLPVNKQVEVLANMLDTKIQMMDQKLAAQLVQKLKSTLSKLV